MFGQDEIKKGSGNEGNFEEVDYRLKPIYMTDDGKSKITFVMLRGYNEETQFSDFDRDVVHQVKGHSKKIRCSRRLRPYEKNGKKAYGYDAPSWTHCEICDKLEEAKDKDGRAKDFIKGVELLVPVYALTHTHRQAKRDAEGKVIKDANGQLSFEMVTETLNEKRVLALPIGDAFFSSARSGVAIALGKLFNKNKLKNYVLSWSYGDLDEIDKMDDNLAKTIKGMRDDQQSVLNFLGQFYPTDYSEWYEKTFSEKWTNPLLKKINQDVLDETFITTAKKIKHYNIKLDLTSLEEVELIEDDGVVPF